MFRAMEKLSRGEHTFIICIGDSITEQNFHLQGKLNYVGQFTEKLMELYNRKSLILNAGKSGDTTWGVLGRLGRDVLNFQPDLVIVMLGINDSERGPEQLAEFKSNLVEIIRRITDSGSEVLLLTQNMLDYHIIESALIARTSYPSYIAAIREVAEDGKISLCDIYREWEKHCKENTNTHLMLMDDSIHPNPRGHTLMAKVLFNYLGLNN